MDRTIQLEKKYSSEFSSTENTVEVHSLQQLGFLMSVCHTMLLVQDWATDMNLIRLLLAAEMLKPMTPSMGGDERSVTEHFPHLVIVQNKRLTGSGGSPQHLKISCEQHLVSNLEGMPMVKTLLSALKASGCSVDLKR